MTPLGKAEAHFLETPEDAENNAVWLCFQSETKEPWQWPSPLVRLCSSISVMRDKYSSEIIISEEYFQTLKPHILRHTHSPFYKRAVQNG